MELDKLFVKWRPIESSVGSWSPTYDVDTALDFGIDNSEDPQPILNKQTVNRAQQVAKQVQPSNTNNSDYSNYGKYAKYLQSGSLERGIHGSQYLMKRLGLTKEQAAGVTGVMIAENGIDPTSYCKGEKDGSLKRKGLSSAGPADYGAGIGSWTFAQTKNTIKEILKQVAGKDKGEIENYSLDEQLEAYCRHLESKPKILNVLKSAKSVEDAADVVARGIEMGGMTGNLISKEWFSGPKLFNSGRGRDENGNVVNGYDQLMYNVNPQIGIGRIIAARGVLSKL